MAIPAINTQVYLFPPNGPYETGISVKTPVTINASGNSNIVTNDAADAANDFTTATANTVFVANAKANSGTKLFVRKSDVSVDGQGFLYIGHISATNVGSDAETITIVEAASCTIPADTMLHASTFAPMLNGRVIDMLAGASASVTGMDINDIRGEIAVVVNYAG